MSQLKSKIVARNKLFLQQLKDKPCMDCGGLFPTVCMQFDHIKERGEKRFNLASAVYGCRTIRSIIAESSKCDLVCANCHAIRTYKRARPA